MDESEFRYKNLKPAQASATPDASQAGAEASAIPQTPAGASPFCEKIMKGGLDHAPADKWIATGQGSSGGQQ